jgi:hypothetical protein
MYGLNSTRFTHLLGGVVGMAPSTVPVALKGFRVEGHLDTPLFCNTDEEVTSHPELISHGDTVAGADLEFPLGRHNLSIDATNPDTSVEASAVMSLN